MANEQGVCARGAGAEQRRFGISVFEILRDRPAVRDNAFTIADHRHQFLVREYVESQEGAIHLEYLPPYAPELNPVEYLWAHWKHHELANFCPKDFAELTVHARAKLRRTQRRKTLIAAFWKQAELPV